MLFNQSVKTIKKIKKSMTKIDCVSVSSKYILFKKEKYNIIKRILGDLEQSYVLGHFFN